MIHNSRDPNNFDFISNPFYPDPNFDEEQSYSSDEYLNIEDFLLSKFDCKEKR